jgi:Family of unknown function (DUF6314)
VSAGPTVAAVEPTDLLGVWDLARRIVERPRDGSAARHGRVVGTLTLAGNGAGVDWIEDGTLSWGGEQLAVTRRLCLVPGETGWWVRFEGGRPFHAWRPGAPVVHRCGDDAYRGLVDVDRAATELRVLWDVTGPAKDLRLFTRCRRARLA